MLVLAFTIPLMVLGLVAAVGPLVAALVRDHRARAGDVSLRTIVVGGPDDELPAETESWRRLPA